MGSEFHSHPGAAFGMRIYEKRVSFVRHNPKFGAKIGNYLGEMSLLTSHLGLLMPSLSLTLKVDP